MDEITFPVTDRLEDPVERKPEPEWRFSEGERVIHHSGTRAVVTEDCEWRLGAASVMWDGQCHREVCPVTSIEACYDATRLEVDNVEDLASLPIKQLSHDGPQADNNARVSFAAHALVSYVQVCKSEGYLDTAFIDLLSDLRHLADAVDVNFGIADDAAARHYEAEIRGKI